ncbi:PIH1 domain-containing protein 1 [Diorhabda sublineata]|uniref:PIH1 domain-containing protein 1 n=1 Tax=Diorhabda sublineata TaxID=1163346 RepID=UPI0024E17C27|nr:PIH1 domain-containing protein 1 [Diorhabda sublineata]
MSRNSKAVFLDVDSSIVEKNLLIRKGNEEEEDINKFFEKQNYPSKLIKPSPGFCIKTREQNDNNKVFINICQTESIPSPKEITSAELQEILESDEPGEYKVPMSIGELRTEKDKKGEQAKVCDIAIHPHFFKKIMEIQTFKNFFLAIVFHGLQDKYNLECVEEKIILKNRKVFGTLQTHRIQDREIREKMNETNTLPILKNFGEQNAKKPLIETISSVENTIKVPEYRLYKKKDGRNCLHGEFKLPDVISAKELTLDIGEDRILLESKSRGYLLDIFIPYYIKQKNCSSSFNKSTKVLTVMMPLVGG